MKFQPGQSGNPAGRPLGARNKKTIAREEELAERAEEAVGRIIYLAGGGHPVAMRICAEWARPGGNSRALALELPKVECADDAQKAFDMVIEAFGDGAITVRELPTMLGSVDRMARVAERIQQNREHERERYKALRVHGIHPDMIPKAPPGWTDPYEELVAKIERGEDPFPDDPVKSAYVLAGEDLYSPVNSDAEAAEEERSEAAAEVSGFPSPRTECGGEGSGVGGDVRSEQQIILPPGGADAALTSTASGGGMGEADGLYSPVNSGAEPSHDAAANPGRDQVAAPGVETVPQTPDSREETIFSSEHASPPTPDPSPPRFAWGEGNPAAAAVADKPQDDSLYSPVNSGASSDEASVISDQERAAVSDP